MGSTGSGDYEDSSNTTSNQYGEHTKLLQSTLLLNMEQAPLVGTIEEQAVGLVLADLETMMVKIAATERATKMVCI